MYKKSYIILSLTLLIVACAPSRFIEPLKKNEQAISVNLGGPIINPGIVLPVPLSAATYGYGIDSNITAFGSIHITSLLFGNIQTDLGTTVSLYRSTETYIPSISTSLNANIIWDVEDKIVRAWPQLDVNSYWQYGKKNHYAYIGISNWFELSKTRYSGQSQIARWIPNPQIGTTLKTKRYQFQLELKFLSPGTNNEFAFVPYATPFKRGALGFYFGVIRTF